ncbi:MAG: geranylgeranyl reductase family protein [Thermoproteota archaeon]
MGIVCDVLIVGGGPSGLSTGSVISQKGFKTIVLEEHNEIGRPEQCTGLVSLKIGDIPQNLILNKIDTARFRFEERWFEVTSKEMLVIDRVGYDKHLAEKALESGIEIRFGERALGFDEGSVLTSRGNRYFSNIIVGADGPNSIIAKLSGLKQPENLLFGLQCVVKGIFEQDVVELRFEPCFSKNAFAWVVPISRSRARVGLLTVDNPLPRMSLLLKRLNVEIDSSKLMGDSIRFGIMSKTVTDGVILVGDAACQVKPFSLGGLVYNRICSRVAGEACIKALEKNIFNESFLLDEYESRWREIIGDALRKGLRVRRAFEMMKKIPISFTLAKILRLGLIAGRILDPDFLRDDFSR